MIEDVVICNQGNPYKKEPIVQTTNSKTDTYNLSITCSCVRFCAKLGTLFEVTIKVIENAKMASENDLFHLYDRLNQILMCLNEANTSIRYCIRP